MHVDRSNNCPEWNGTFPIPKNDQNEKSSKLLKKVPNSKNQKPQADRSIAFSHCSCLCLRGRLGLESCSFKPITWEPDIVSKFEPAILCDIRSWDYTVPAGALRHDLQPGLHGIQRALTKRPRRLQEGDALVVSALDIIAHFKSGSSRTRPPGCSNARSGSTLGGRDQKETHTITTVPSLHPNLDCP